MPRSRRSRAAIRGHMDKMHELRDVEDTRPLPGIEWDLDINREMASRFGANAQSIGTAVQLVTNGILVGKYRPDDSQDEVDIRVRYPSRVRAASRRSTICACPPPTAAWCRSAISSRRKPAQQVNSIERVDGHRVYHVRANVKPGVNAERAEDPASRSRQDQMDRHAELPARRPRLVQGRQRAAGRIRRVPDRSRHSWRCS